MRRTLILIHLLIASFVAPAFILVGVSGGLYLLGIKGSVETTQLNIAGDLDFTSPKLETEIRDLLANQNVEHSFEYLKNRGSLVQTRPTSKTYLEFTNTDSGLEVTRNVPSLQKSMIELHMGHGPSAFKTYQKFVAASLILVMLSGVWLGISNAGLRRKTLITTVAGTVLFFILALT